MSVVDPSSLSVVADAAQHAPDAASAIGTALTTSGGLGVLGWLFLRSKLDSLGLLWKKYDALEKCLAEKMTGLAREMADNRLADAKEFATRAELTRMVEKLELHFDKRFDELERKLDAKGR